MSHRHPSKGSPPVRLRPRVKVWLELDGEYVFGLGICQMLQAVDETGSIKEAAARLGKSYRYVWGRIKQVEETLGQPLVEARVGGKEARRSHLTPTAKRLVDDFLALRQRMFDVVEQEFPGRFRGTSHRTRPAP